MEKGNGWDKLIEAYTTGGSDEAPEVDLSFGQLLALLNKIQDRLDDIYFMLWDKESAK